MNSQESYNQTVKIMQRSQQRFKKFFFAFAVVAAALIHSDI